MATDLREAIAEWLEGPCEKRYDPFLDDVWYYLADTRDLDEKLERLLRRVAHEASCHGMSDTAAIRAALEEQDYRQKTPK